MERNFLKFGDLIIIKSIYSAQEGIKYKLLIYRFRWRNIVIM